MPAVLDPVARTRSSRRRVASKKIDPERLPQGFELVAGKLVEKEGMGFKSGFYNAQLIAELIWFLRRTGIGICAGSDATFACVPGNPKQVRKPDAAVILCDPKTFVPPETNFTSAPDIVIEVISPSDTFGNLFDRIHEFLAAGSKEAWLVNPSHRSIEIHRADGTVTHFKPPAVLTTPILPGFELSLATLFG